MPSTVPNRSKIDQPWPSEDVEAVECCPYCNSRDRTLAHRNVQDWSFYSAPGKWTYWSCTQCDSLYLDPRPTPETLGRAYGAYYTHQGPEKESLVQRLTNRLRNECWSHWLQADLRPRLHIPAILRWLLFPLKARLVEPFELAELVKLQPGKLVDVGCGNGRLLSLVKDLGWDALGVEVDPAAARVARARGLNVIEGSYRRVAEFSHTLDCIICSHVLEHVHDPLDMLAELATALKPGGTLLIASPNATSVMRRHFGDDWRGLEAPRHLSIPSMRQLEHYLRNVGFRVRQRKLTGLWTAAESARIQRRGVAITRSDKVVQKSLSASTVVLREEECDFIQFVCVKERLHAD